MKNRKGFTLVELLATVTIVGVIAVIGAIAYTRYIENTKQQAYDTLAESAYHATENYFLVNPAKSKVTLKVLVEGEYLENYKDPAGGANCTTKSVVNVKSNGTYKVKLCCTNYSFIYTFPGGTKVETTC